MLDRGFGLFQIGIRHSEMEWFHYIYSNNIISAICLHEEVRSKMHKYSNMVTDIYRAAISGDVNA